MRVAAVQLEVKLGDVEANLEASERLARAAAADGAAEEVPGRFWLHRRGAMAAYSWNSQRLHGRRWYRRNVSGRVDKRARPVTAPTA